MSALGVSSNHGPLVSCTLPACTVCKPRRTKADVVDVSWLTAGQTATVEFKWGTVTGVVCKIGQEIRFGDSPAGPLLRFADGATATTVVRVVSPAPPVTPAAEEWAEGDLAWVTDELDPNPRLMMRAVMGWESLPDGVTIPEWLGDDWDGSATFTAAVVCPPGLTPVDLDELAEKVAALEPPWFWMRGRPWEVGIEHAARYIASYRRSGSAER